MNLKALTKTARRTLSRNSSKILLGLGIAGAFTAVGFAITATPKAMILLEEKKQERGGEKLDAKTIIKTAAPVYIPTAISMGISTGCIIAASSVNDRRNAALAAACTMSETALRSYQDKVVETVGPEKAKEIKEAVTLEKMAKCPEPDEIPTAKNLAPDDVSYDKKVKCWESLSGKYFWTTRNAIEKALNGLNKQLLSDLSVTENDLYDYLGMEHCKNGDLLGWDTQSCMMVDTFYGSRVDEEGMSWRRHTRAMWSMTWTICAMLSCSLPQAARIRLIFASRRWQRCISSPKRKQRARLIFWKPLSRSLTVRFFRTFSSSTGNWQARISRFIAW
jgi:hypothetical protein